MTFRIKFNRQRWPAADVMPRMAHATDEAAHDAAEFILEHANKRAPLETGKLIDSSRVEVDHGSATIYYDSPYARKLHEHPEYHFQNGREGKWLQNTILEMGREVPVQLAPALMRALGGMAGNVGGSLFETGAQVAQRVLAEARKYG